MLILGVGPGLHNVAALGKSQTAIVSKKSSNQYNNIPFAIKTSTLGKHLHCEGGHNRKNHKIRSPQYEDKSH